MRIRFRPAQDISFLSWDANAPLLHYTYLASISSFLKRNTSSPSILIRRPPNSGSRTLSPTATETSMWWPSLDFMPGPTARISPSFAFVTVDSGRKMPPAVYNWEFISNHISKGSMGMESFGSVMKLPWSELQLSLLGPCHLGGWAFVDWTGDRGNSRRLCLRQDSSFFWESYSKTDSTMLNLKTREEPNRGEVELWLCRRDLCFSASLCYTSISHLILRPPIRLFHFLCQVSESKVQGPSEEFVNKRPAAALCRVTVH